MNGYANTVSLSAWLLAGALAACGASGVSDPKPEPVAVDAGEGEGGGGASAKVDAASGPTLPFIVDDWFAAGGYMGDGSQPGGIVDAPDCASPRPGQARGICHRFTWTPGPMGWGGVYWQYPDGNWGSVPGLKMPAGATKVSFYAWGESGGETITFMVGMADVDGFQVKKDVVLTTTPTQYTIDLSSSAYGVVVGGFGWTAAESQQKVSFELDDIIWE